MTNIGNSKIVFSRRRRRYTHVARTICLCDVGDERRRARAHQEAFGRDLVVARQIVAQMHACFIRPERHRAFSDRRGDGVFDAFWSTERISGTGEIVPVDLCTDVIRESGVLVRGTILPPDNICQNVETWHTPMLS